MKKSLLILIGVVALCGCGNKELEGTNSNKENINNEGIKENTVVKDEFGMVEADYKILTCSESDLWDGEGSPYTMSIKAYFKEDVFVKYGQLITIDKSQTTAEELIDPKEEMEMMCDDYDAETASCEIVDNTKELTVKILYTDSYFNENLKDENYTLEELKTEVEGEGVTCTIK